MTKTINTALKSKAAQSLFAAGLKFVSTPRQIENGTIALAGKIKRKPVSYKITANGAVLSNEFVARTVYAETPAKMYNTGLKAALELLEKRLA